jgi:pimeloyl-ACP methyl ester carboxylesterase
MDIPFKSWPALESCAKLFPSRRFPGLFYYDYAPKADPGKPALVLVHGLGDEADTWRHVIPLFGEAGYRVLAPDLPGFGRSPFVRRSGLTAHRDAVRELAGAVSEFSAERAGPGVVLVGSSMGAAVACAAVLAGFPAKALVLLDGCIPLEKAIAPPLLLSALPFIGKAWYREFRNNPEGAWASLFSYYADIQALGDDDKQFLRARVMDRVQSPFQERAYFSTLRSMIVENLRASYYRRIASWPGNIALVWGEEDRVMPKTEAEAFIKLRNNTATELSMIQGAGHLPHQEKPKETAEAVLAFLRRIES